MITALKLIQLATTLLVIVLFWLIYPAVMVLFASAVQLLYFTCKFCCPAHEFRLLIKSEQKPPTNLAIFFLSVSLLEIS